MASIIHQKTRSFYIEEYTNKKPMADMHYHHAFELYYTVEGERDYFVGDHYFKIRKNDLVYIPSGMLHRTTGKGATRFLAYFTKEYLQQYFTDNLLARLLPDEPFVFRFEDENTTLYDEMSALLTEFAKQEEGPEEARDGVLLASGLFRILFLLATSTNLYVSSIQSEERLTRIVKYVNENFAAINSLDEVAQRFFISKYYLCHAFKKHLGVSFVTYLNTLRIRAACRLLRKGSLRLTEIAAACGFNSTSYFCKVFKDELGLSPREYMTMPEA